MGAEIWPKGNTASGGTKAAKIVTTLENSSKRVMMKTENWIASLREWTKYSKDIGCMTSTIGTPEIYSAHRESTAIYKDEPLRS